MNTDISGLARQLVELGELTQDQALETMRSARNQSQSFIRQCCQERLVDHARLASAISSVFGLPLLDLDQFHQGLPQDRLITRALQEKTVTLPLGYRGNRLVLAVSDPSQTQAIREIEFHSGKAADLVIAPYGQLIARIGQSSRKTRSRAQSGLTDSVENVRKADFLHSQREEKILPSIENEVPVVRAVDRLLLEATALKASDIHLEPYEKTFRIRIRVDGVLREFASPPIHLAGRLVSRLKIMAQLDISERRLPQDGRIRLHRDGQRAVDFRISTLPTLWGEKTVLRVMDPLQARLELDQLGFAAVQNKLVHEALIRPQGLILVTGPTGSGKSVTLYSALTRLNDTSRNISTAEDPVELNIPGINQVPMKPAIGLGFSTALRAFLRQDPDVIMVGEIRDRETTDIAIKAAQTGHLVLSTLHTNSATETLTRLLGMGIEPYNVVSSLTLIIAQRLARRLCPHCREPAPETAELLLGQHGGESLIGNGRFFKARGCDHCHEGYQGRIGIYEVVPISDALSRTIIAGNNSLEIAEQARNAGYASLRQSALAKMAEGLTSLEEVLRIS
ncbi:MAG: type IV-A pilus assembly ATPase PilB [Gammaproteobacteria bacterium]|nr:type IV-A pilus assembly ATPase PilB [Planctomycetaceae bacterium]MCB1671576.1 type IV-A pilus assembly ATPase PilB [Pseudomonadales bacterium]MCP5345580.1 type IV-A pilus assembly ATPase PilB [Pseudomonadales bacterium]